MRSSRRTAGWRITEGPGAALPARVPWHSWLSLGWHHALLALRLFPLQPSRPRPDAGRGHGPMSPSRGAAAAGRAPQLPGSPLPLQDLPGGWNAGSSAVSSPSCPSPPQPGQPLSPKSTSCSRDCHRELAGMSTWSPILPYVYSCFFLLPLPAWPGLAPLPSKQPLAGMPTHPLAFPGKQLPWAGRGWFPPSLPHWDCGSLRTTT